MRVGSLRMLALAAALLALSLPAAALAGGTGARGDRGVVQAVDASHIVLRALDGSTISFAIFPGTKVRLNGEAASIADIGPGSVADIVVDRKGRTALIVVFGAQGPGVATTERGVVVSLTRATLTYDPADGPPRTATVDQSTRYRLAGRPAKRNVVRPGAVVAVTRVGDGPALVVNVLKRPGA